MIWAKHILLFLRLLWPISGGPIPNTYFMFSNFKFYNDKERVFFWRISGGLAGPLLNNVIYIIYYYYYYIFVIIYFFFVFCGQLVEDWRDRSSMELLSLSLSSAEHCAQMHRSLSLSFWENKTKSLMMF